jgi:hypothetical protein
MLVLVLERHNGILQASKIFEDVEKLWEAREVAFFKQGLSNVGDLQMFVIDHPDTFEWLCEGSYAGREAVSLTSGVRGAESCVAALYELLERNDGTLLASRVFKELKISAPAAFDSFKREVERSGSMKKFVQQYWDRFEWTVTGGPGMDAISLVKRDHPSLTCADLIEEVLRWHGGKVLVSKLLGEMKAWKPYQFESCKKELQAAGGLKQFLSLHDKQFTFSHADPLCTAFVRLAPEQSASDDFVKPLVELVKWHGGTLLASMVFIEMKAWRQDIYEHFKIEVNDVGGLKRYVAMHRSELDWVSDGGGGKNAVRALNCAPCSDEESTKYEWSLGLLEDLIDWHGGQLLASRIVQDLRAWKPDELAKFKSEVTEAGGLKKLIMKGFGRFEWVFDEDPGREAVRLSWPSSMPVQSESQQFKGQALSRYQ